MTNHYTYFCGKLQSDAEFTERLELDNEIERLERELADAYERAAQVCDESSAKAHAFYSQSKENSIQADYWLGASAEARHNAEEIRALKGKP